MQRMIRNVMQQNEEWKEIPYWTDYKVSNFGRVKRVNVYGLGEDRILHKPKKGRNRACLSSSSRIQTFRVSRLVLLAFVGPPPFPEAQARHLDDDCTNDCLDNLAWGTHQQNMDDGKRNNRFLIRRGEDCSSSKLLDFEIRHIKFKYSTGKYSQSELAKEYKVTQSHISLVVREKTRRFVK